MGSRLKLWIVQGDIDEELVQAVVWAADEEQALKLARHNRPRLRFDPELRFFEHPGRGWVGPNHYCGVLIDPDDVSYPVEPGTAVVPTTTLIVLG